MLTNGGKARRILLNPEGFFKDDFNILTSKDLAKYLGVAQSQISEYRRKPNHLPPEREKQLVKLFDDLYGNGYAGSLDNDDYDVQDKVQEILTNPRQFLDENNRPLTMVTLAKMLNTRRERLYIYRKDYSKVPDDIRKKLAQYYDTLLRVDEIPDESEDYIRLLQSVRTEDEMFDTVQTEVAEVIKQGLKQINVTSYTKQVLNTLIEGINVKHSSLLRIIIMMMNQNRK